jgi:hypothetical protein
MGGSSLLSSAEARSVEPRLRVHDSSTIIFGIHIREAS